MQWLMVGHVPTALRVGDFFSFVERVDGMLFDGTLFTGNNSAAGSSLAGPL